MTDWREPATRISEFTNDIMDFCESDPHLFLEMIQERENFLTKTPKKYYPTQEDEESADLRFEDYFIYSYTSRHYRQKPLKLFLSKMLSKYNQKEQKILQGFQDNIFSAFMIREVFPGYYFIAKDLSSGQEFKVRDNQATFQMKKNDCFFGRILPYETDYALSIVNLFLPAIPSYTAKRVWDNVPSQFFREIDPLLIERHVIQKSPEDKDRKAGDSGYQESIENIGKVEDIESIEKKLRNFLKKHLGKKAPSIKSLRKKINRVTNPLPIIEELAEMMHIYSQEEFITLQQLFYDFWNNTPRDEFQGKSPEEIASGSMGPLEKELLDDFMNYVQRNMDITKFSNKGELEKAVKELQEKWLTEPQEELDGKTPLEAIKEEREKINSPRKDSPFLLNIEPIELNPEDPYNLSDFNEKDSPVVRDVETFVCYFLENRVKVTPTNRWIPFQHLKRIEEKFINPTKDSFTFMEKEENRGEEKRKPYIHFIHLLSRAERLIYTDKRGYVQVNRKHFKDFTENSYGENVIKLMIDWIEKVDWVKLQATEYTTFNAQQYQENIVGIWKYFYLAKPNEKNTPTTLTKQIYSNSSKEEKELEEIAQELAYDVQSILLRYLEWFGAIDTLEKIIHPELVIRVIKEFWVTPKGKKLIDRVVLDFWEKGRIKFNKSKPQ